MGEDRPLLLAERVAPLLKLDGRTDRKRNSRGGRCSRRSASDHRRTMAKAHFVRRALAPCSCRWPAGSRLLAGREFSAFVARMSAATSGASASRISLRSCGLRLPAWHERASHMRCCVPSWSDQDAIDHLESDGRNQTLRPPHVVAASASSLRVFRDSRRKARLMQRSLYAKPVLCSPAKPGLGLGAL